MEKIQKKYRYIFITLCLTCSVMFLKKSNIFESISESIKLRYLQERKVQNYVCDKAGSRITDRYKGGYDEDALDEKPLTKAQQSIIDFARDNSYDNIKPYIKKCAIFIAILVLDIIFIFFWIAYCGCCCCRCCLFGKPNSPSKVCENCNFLISVSCGLLVIIFSLVILGSINPYFKRLNGLVCSASHFLDHVRNGLSPHYPSHQAEWIGIENYLDRLNYSNEQYKDIKNYTEENCELNINTCSDIYQTYKKDCEEVRRIIESSFGDINFDEEIDDLYSAYDSFDSAVDDINDDKVYDVIHDYLNGITKKVIIAIFTLTLIFGALGICFLVLYKFCRICIFKVLYVVIWNISMLLMLLSILSGVILGILGYIGKDGVAVGRYILSADNLHSDDPLVFSSSGNVDELIDICVNGNGSFYGVLQDSGEIFKNIEELRKNNDDYKTTIEQLNECPDLRDGYNRLQEVNEKALNISLNLTDVRCNFARNDKNIILNEAHSFGKRGVTLCAFALLVGFLLGISILTGIFFVHRYNEETPEGEATEAKINESSDKIREEK